MYKLSFIIPVYNAQDYIDNCVKSIIAQDGFDDVEIVLVDDGSADASSAICDMYSEFYKNISVVHQPNSGVSVARNNGIKAAKGKYVAFCDADDFLFDGIVPKLLEAIDNNDADLFCYGFKTEYPDCHKDIEFPFEKNVLSDENYIKKDIAEFMLSDSSFNSVWTKAIKKEVIINNNILFEAGRKYGEDKFFVLEVLTKCKSAFYVPFIGYYYAMCATGAIQKAREDYFESAFKDYDNTIEFYKCFNIDSEQVIEKSRRLLAQSIIGSVMMAYRNCSKKEFKKVIALLQKQSERVLEILHYGLFDGAIDTKVILLALDNKISSVRRVLKTCDVKADIYKKLHKDAPTANKEKIEPYFKNTERLKYPYSMTVFTPIYNRKHTIHRVFDGLMKQTCKDFEWLIVDDGSTDGVGELIEQYKKEADFPIRYYYKKNGGKHTASNFACRLMNSDYLYIMDSDDAPTPDAVEYFYREWNKIPEEKRKEYWSVVARCVDAQTNEPLTEAFPENINEIENTREVAGRIIGDKCACIRTDIYKAFPFPEPEGTTFVTESVVWNRIEKYYKQHYTNGLEKIVYKEGDSLSRDWYRTHIKEGYVSNYFWMVSELNEGVNVNIKTTVVQIMYYGYVSGKSYRQMIKDINSNKYKILCTLVFPSASILKKLKYDRIIKENNIE